MELSPNSRFQVLDNPNALPGKCTLCGSVGGDGRKFVDFGMSLDYYGVVYFCTFCVTELAEAIGFISERRFNEIREAYNDLGRQYNSLLEEAREVENAARILVRNCNCGPSVSGEFFTPVDVEANSSPESTDSHSDESSGIEGFDGVHDSSNEQSSSDGSSESDSPDGRPIDGPSTRKTVRKSRARSE